MRSFVILCSAAIAASVLLSGCAVPTPVVNPRPQEVTAQISAQTMHDAIVKAAQQRKWRIVSDEPSRMTLAYPGTAKAVHFEAIVRVDYTAKDYRISYVSSRGLDERMGCVNPKIQGGNSYDENALCAHRNVNRWMNNLSAHILKNLYQYKAPAA